MEKYLKNINFDEVVSFKDLVSYQEGQVVSRTLVQNKSISITLFAFAAGEEIGAHDSRGDALVHILDGEGVLIVGGKRHNPKTGDAVVMPANVLHSVHAEKPFKMLLVVVFPEAK